MNLWNIIRDFYVQHVWGGKLSNGTNVGSGRIGSLLTNTGQSKSASFLDFYVPINASYFDGSEITYINIGDWLSTTSTIITLVVILVCIAFFIRWIFKVCSNAILLR